MNADNLMVDEESVVAAAALNEQGFLFQQRTLGTIQSYEDGAWTTAAVEYPISFGLPGSFETKIDAVLEHEDSHKWTWHLTLECKRAHKDFKRWIFFDRESQMEGIDGSRIFFQRADLSGSWLRRPDTLPPIIHRIDNIVTPADCEVFNFYLEARINRAKSPQRTSATQAIEESMRQVGRGLVGLSRDLVSRQQTNFRILPVIVTTADIYAAEFGLTDVSLDRGMIAPDAISLSPKKWLAVNYRLDGSISRFAELTTNRPKSVSEAMWTRFVRSVFVVRSECLPEFLDWLPENLIAKASIV